MSEENITRTTLVELMTQSGATDWARVAEADGDDPDDFDWSKAEPAPPVGKELVSIRLDDDVLAFFRRGGKGYQTRINAILRSYMKAKLPE